MVIKTKNYKKIERLAKQITDCTGDLKKISTRLDTIADRSDVGSLSHGDLHDISKYVLHMVALLEGD